jgi:hypothetical protein
MLLYLGRHLCQEEVCSQVIEVVVLNRVYILEHYDHLACWNVVWQRFTDVLWGLLKQNVPTS